MKDFAERYYREQVLRNWKDPKHVRRYIANDILPAFGTKTLRDVNALHVQALVYRRAPANANQPGPNPAGLALPSAATAESVWRWRTSFPGGRRLSP